MASRFSRAAAPQLLVARAAPTLLLRSLQALCTHLLGTSFSATVKVPVTIQPWYRCGAWCRAGA